MKVLVATEKPFAKVAVDGIKDIFTKAGIETVLLEKYTDTNDLLKAAADVDGMIVRSDKVTKEVVEAAKNLKIVVRAGAGYDNLDLAACTAKQVVAMNTPGQNSNAVAELALGMMIYMARCTFQPGTGSELKGKKLGIHGFGHVGRLIANLGKSLGMEIFVYELYANPQQIKEVGTMCANVEELYSACNYISLNIPAVEGTIKSINYALLSKTPKGTTIVNTARKEIIDEDGLLKLMDERQDFKYITDVAPSCHVAMTEKFGTRYFATPKKIGAETAEANINAGLAAANQIVGFLKNGDKTFQLNK